MIHRVTGALDWQTVVQAGVRLQVGWLMVALALALLPSALTRQLMSKRRYV